MNQRERIRSILRFEPFDRLPVIEWAPWWSLTLERWRGEGLPSHLQRIDEISDWLGLDRLKYRHYSPRAPGCPNPPGHGLGIIADESEYERVRPYLYPENVICEDPWRAWAEEQARGDTALWVNVDGFFWWPRVLLGIERHFYAFYDQPDLLHRINQDLASWHLQIIGELDRYATLEFFCFAEDMSYNHGPMLSRELFETFLAPYYRQVIPEIKKRGSLVFIDSDGDISPAIPWFLEVGIEGVLPLERQAGVDVAQLRTHFPRLRMLGAFDKMTMARGEEMMRAEFERLLPVARQGGFLIGCDHQTPPGVSLEHYRLFLRLFREYSWKAGSRL